MRIHSDILTGSQIKYIIDGFRLTPGVTVHIASEPGSRKRRRAFEVALRGHAVRHNRAPNTRDGRFPGKAATRHDWGHFLAALYQADPEMIAGPYKSRLDFHSQTKSEYVYD